MRKAFTLLVVVCASCAGNCELAPDFARMIEQPRGDPYEASRFFTDGRTMRPLVAGSVPRSATLGPPELVEGSAAGQYVNRVPLPVTRAFVAQGRDRFQVHCAPCHGGLGDGRSQVAENMRLRRPPSFHVEPYVSYPPGRYFAVITHGFGFMRSYAGELSIEERWSVVAYLQALQRSQAQPLARLPVQLAEEARPWLR
jgi:mono/diheme cytochrome c family protein